MNAHVGDFLSGTSCTIEGIPTDGGDTSVNHILYEHKTIHIILHCTWPFVGTRTPETEKSSKIWEVLWYVRLYLSVGRLVLFYLLVGHLQARIREWERISLTLSVQREQVLSIFFTFHLLFLGVEWNYLQSNIQPAKTLRSFIETGQAYQHNYSNFVSDLLSFDAVGPCSVIWILANGVFNNRW